MKYTHRQKFVINLLGGCILFFPLVSFAQAGCPQTTVTWGNGAHTCSGVASHTLGNDILVINDIEGKGQAKFQCNPQTNQFERPLDNPSADTCKQAYACPSMAINWQGANKICQGKTDEVPVNQRARITSESDGKGYADIVCKFDNNNFSYGFINSVCE